MQQRKLKPPGHRCSFESQTQADLVSGVLFKVPAGDVRAWERTRDALNFQDVISL